MIHNSVILLCDVPEFTKEVMEKYVILIYLSEYLLCLCGKKNIPQAEWLSQRKGETENPLNPINHSSDNYMLQISIMIIKILKIPARLNVVRTGAFHTEMRAVVSNAAQCARISFIKMLCNVVFLQSFAALMPFAGADIPAVKHSILSVRETLFKPAWHKI
jgi:hypothetical protein